MFSTCIRLRAGWSASGERFSSQPPGQERSFAHNSNSCSSDVQTLTPVNACIFNFIVNIALLCLIFAGPIAIGAIFSVGALGQ